MNTKDFLSLLKDIHKLTTISYEQLDKLLLQFPYCHNLRLLLLKKYQTDDHISFDRQLTLASTYSPDRQFLNHFIQTKPSLNKVIPIQNKPNLEQKEEEIVEKNITTAPVEEVVESETLTEEVIEEETVLEDEVLDKETPIEETIKEEGIEEVENIEEEAVELEADLDIKHKVSETPPRLDLMEIVALTKENNVLDEEEREISFMPLEEWVQSFTPPRINDKSETNPRRKRFKLSRIPVFEDRKMLDLFEKNDKTPEKEEVEDKIIAPTEEKQLEKVEEPKIEDKEEELNTEEEQPKEEEPAQKPFDFFSESTEAFLKSLSSKKQKKTKSTSSKVDYMAKESVTENEEVISETLANLLALQGKKDKAIKMYNALSLKFPEKSRFFAEKIEELSGDA
ncbi:MAG: hypothetical protein GY810_08860 [Aureispira sp.]|nr:hypothetical protein [Aureispira sp.]